MEKNTKIDFAVGIGGENGQGIASTGDILARIFARRDSTHAYNAYQSIIRGGHTFLTIRVSDTPVTNMGTRSTSSFSQSGHDESHLRLLKAGACAIYVRRENHAREVADGVQLCSIAHEGVDQGQ
jgi:2-oxoglutarate ferredoxin oxidoreductase subunit alpha